MLLSHFLPHESAAPAIAIAVYFGIGVVVAGAFCYDKTRNPARLMLCAWASVLAWPLVVLFVVIERAFNSRGA